MRIIPGVLTALSFALALAPASGVLAQSEGDPIKGRQLAAAHCTECHNIELGGPAKAYPPSFAAIARFRDAQQIRSRIYFPPWHASMPEFGATMWPDQVDDLTAYIQSLER